MPDSAVALMARYRLTGEQQRTGSHLPARLRKQIRGHEERHQRCARAFGADIDWEFDDDGGASFEIIRCGHLEPVQFAAVFYAGSGGTWWGASGCDKVDEKVAQRWIERYPRGERAPQKAEAYRLARKYA